MPGPATQRPDRPTEASEAPARRGAGLPPGPAGFIALAALALLVVLPLFRPIISVDAGWHLALGRWIWHEGALPTLDPLLSTSGRDLPTGIVDPALPLPDEWLAASRCSWLADLLLFGSWAVVGAVGPQIARALCFLAALTFVSSSLRRLDVSPLWSLAALGLAASFLSGFVMVRPSAMSIALVALSSALWLSFWRRSEVRWAWAAVLLLPLWAQIHPGFLYGVALAAAWVVGLLCEPLRSSRPAPASPATLFALGAVALVGPFLLHPMGGIAFLSTLQRFAQTASVLGSALSAEFARPDPLRAAPIYAVAVGSALLLPLLWHRRPLPWTLVVVGYSGMAVSSLRHGFLLPVVVVPFALDGFFDLLDRPGVQRLRPLLATAAPVALLLTLCAGQLFPHPRFWSVGWHPLHPTEMAELLTRDLPPGLPYNAYEQGGFLEWQIPQVAWFTDSRLLNPRFFYLTVEARRNPLGGTEGPNWRRLFEHYGLSWAVVPVFYGRPDLELVLELLRAPDWALAGTADRSFLFVRIEPATAAYRARHELTAEEYRELLVPLVRETRREGPLLLADALVAAGELPAARGLLESLAEGGPASVGARQRLAAWTKYVAPALATLGSLEGGEGYREPLGPLDPPTDPP